MKQLDPSVVHGIALHYYTMPIWPAMESATEFDDTLYYETIAAATFLDELLTRHTEIMNRYDPDCKIGLVVDEWGCWHEVESGTNPAFLYQQNTMRDAMVAAISLNIFNRHSKRVVMANLAQAVNVLHSLILTENEKLIKTPTYHVFDLYKDHQGGEAIYCYNDTINMYEKKNAPMISSSASIKEDIMTITLANCSPYEEAKVSCSINYFNGTQAAARILTEDIHAYNDFDHPDKVKIADHPVLLTEDQLSVTLPPCSIVSIQIK